MSRKLITIFAMILLVFFAAAQEEEEQTEFDPETGSCPPGAQACEIPADYTGPITVGGGPIVYKGQSIYPTSIELENGEIKSFTGDLLQPLEISGVKVQGTGIEFHDDKFSITKGKIEDIEVESAVSVSVENGVISGAISGTGKVASVLLSDGTVFSYDKNTGKLTISGPQSHAVVPRGMQEGSIIVAGGATIEVIDGSGLMLSNGEVRIMNGKAYVETTEYGDFAGMSLMGSVSVCTEASKCDPVNPDGYIVLSQTKIEAHGTGQLKILENNPVIHTEGKTFIADTMGRGYIKIEGDTVEMNDAFLINGGVILEASADGTIYKRYYEGFHPPTESVQMAYIGLDEEGDDKLSKDAGEDMTIAVLENGDTAVGSCPAAPIGAVIGLPDCPLQAVIKVASVQALAGAKEIDPSGTVFDEDLKNIGKFYIDNNKRIYCVGDKCDNILAEIRNHNLYMYDISGKTKIEEKKLMYVNEYSTQNLEQDLKKLDPEAQVRSSFVQGRESKIIHLPKYESNYDIEYDDIGGGKYRVTLTAKQFNSNVLGGAVTVDFYDEERDIFEVTTPDGKNAYYSQNGEIFFEPEANDHLSGILVEEFEEKKMVAYQINPNPPPPEQKPDNPPQRAITAEQAEKLLPKVKGSWEQHTTEKNCRVEYGEKVLGMSLPTRNILCWSGKRWEERY